MIEILTLPLLIPGALLLNAGMFIYGPSGSDNSDSGILSYPFTFLRGLLAYPFLLSGSICFFLADKIIVHVD